MPSPDHITAGQFEALARLMFGAEWQRATAELLGVNLRNVQFWSATPPARGKPVPPGVAADLIAAVQRRMVEPGEAEKMAREVGRLAENLEILRRVTGLDFEIPKGG